MLRKEEYPLEKVTLWLREGDFKWLQEVHPRSGAAKVVRHLIIQHRKRVEAKVEQRKLALEEV